MAESLLTIEADKAAVLDLLARLPGRVSSRLKKVAQGTANRIAHEARRRVSVLSGLTQQGIVVEDLETGDGYAVVARRHPMPNLPLWLERGTIHMEARPFFDAAGRLEEGPHLRRVREALEDEVAGLGS